MLLEREVFMITIANPDKYIVGAYERLSDAKIEVGNGKVIEINEDEKESGSISTQKLFNENFCKEHNIQLYKHYTDDGYSGASFDRPDFNKMIQDIENKKINMVIVKDLSRFGRVSNLISYYLEEYFIEKGVRFIAVNDDIDTGSIETSEDMVQFKAFFNEWYLRDTSKKVRNGKKTRAKEGKVMTTYATYGYKKDPLDKNHYIVDQDIAPIVRRIFMLARNGMTPTQIANIMTNEKTLVPSEVVGNSHLRTNDEIKRKWNRNTIMGILQNVTYLGWVSNGNTKKINYKSKKIMTIPKEERIIVKGMHTPIIDEETFNIVQDMIKSRTSVRTKTYDWLLKGIITCEECGKKLSIVPQKHPNKTTFYLRCNTYACNTHLGLCTPHSNNLEKVTDIVIEQIRNRCKKILEEQKYLKIADTSKDKIMKDKYNIKNEITILENKVKEINKMINKLFEDKFKGLYDDEDFTRVYGIKKEERKIAEERIQILKDQEKKQDSSVDITKLVKDFVNMKEVTRTMLVSLVDRIEISEQKEITIYYKFNILNMENNKLKNVG